MEQTNIGKEILEHNEAVLKQQTAEGHRFSCSGGYDDIKRQVGADLSNGLKSILEPLLSSINMPKSFEIFPYYWHAPMYAYNSFVLQGVMNAAPDAGGHVGAGCNFKIIATDEHYARSYQEHLGEAGDRLILWHHGIYVQQFNLKDNKPLIEEDGKKKYLEFAWKWIETNVLSQLMTAGADTPR